MHPKRKRKLTAIVMILFAVSTAAGLMLYALRQNINLFYTPTELLQAQIAPNTIVRIGGFVEKNSTQYSASGKNILFAVTDRKHHIAVNYQGVLPSLFREGQGIVVTGKFTQTRQLIASQVLAKHDENYMPAMLSKALKKL